MRLFALMIWFVLASIGIAFAAGTIVTDTNNRPTGYHSPNAATAKCTTTTTTKGVIDTVNVAGYSTIHWEASDSTNVAKRIRRFINSNTAYMPGTGDKEGLNTSMTSYTFKPYSAASAAYTVCTDLQKGGKTP